MRVFPPPRYGIAVALIAVALFFSLVLSALGLRMSLALFVGAVLVSALQGGFRLGLVATVLGIVALAADYWLLSPQSNHDSRQWVLLLCAFIVGALLSSHLGEQFRRAVAAVDWIDSAFSTIGDGAVFTDHDGRITFINPAAQELLGQPQEQAKGKLFKETFHPLDQDTRLPRQTGLLKVLEKASVAAERALLVSRHGTDVHVDVRATALRDKQGASAGVIITFRDITAAWQAEQKIKRSEERLRSLVATAHTAILELDAKGRCAAANRACQHLLGIHLDDCLGEGWLRCVHPEDRAMALAASSAATHAGDEQTCELRLQTPNNHLRWARVHFTPCNGERGELLGYVAVLENITEQKQAEEHNRQASALLTAVAENLPEALLVKDLEGRYLLANPAAAHMLGKDARDILGKDDKHLLAAEAARQAHEHDQQALGAGQPQTWEHSEQTKTGSRHFVTRRTPFHSHLGKPAGLILTIRDVTDERCAQELLQESEQRLAQETQKRQNAEKTLQESQATQQLLEEQIADLNRQIAGLKLEADAGKHAEEKLHAIQSDAQVHQQRCTELLDANTALQHAMEEDIRTLEQRTTELQQSQTALETERTAREQAEAALRENQSQLQLLEERIADLQRENVLLQEQFHRQAIPVVPSQEDFGEALFASNADGISVTEEPPGNGEHSPLSDVPTDEASVQMPASEKALDPPTNGHGSVSDAAEKVPNEWLSFN